MWSCTPTTRWMPPSICAMTSDQSLGRVAFRRCAWALALSVGLWGNALAQGALAGQVLAVSGEVKAIDSAGKERPLVRGAPVRQGDRVVTADGALVQIKMSDGGMISVRPGTEVSFDRYVHDEANPKNSGAALSLVRGGLRSITGMIGKANPDAYQIKTPSATIGIRGTDHEPVYIPPPLPGLPPPPEPPGVYDKVNQGETFIRNDLGTIALKIGQVGFAPLATRVPPAVLEKIPDFYRLELKFDGSAMKREIKGDGKVDTARQRLMPAGTVLRAGSELDVKAVDSTTPLSSTVIKSSTLDAPLTTSIDTSTTLSPTVVKSTTLDAPLSTSTLSTTTISPTLVSPTTTTTSTTSTLSTTTLKSTTTISPTLLNSTTTLIK